MRNLSYENEFRIQFHFHANQSHFHKNGFALRLALKQRHKGTRKWPTEFTYSNFPCYFKVKSDKPLVTFRRWISKTGKRLTITANF